MRVLVAFVFALGCAGSERAPLAGAPETLETGVDAGTDSASTDSAAAADAPAEASFDAAVAERRVLFIGNSYTYVNDLPKLVADLSTTSGLSPRLVTESVTVGGATLQDHWNGGTATARIDETKWYAVVLQGQSVEPILPGSTFASYAKKLADRTTTASALPVFYGTWARASGDAVFAETWSGGTPEAMQDKLTAAYSSAATAGKGVLAKVGEAFRTSLKEKPTLALHVDDKSHPSIAGTYLAACVFYGVLAGRPVPDVSSVPTGLAGADATHLRGVAARSVP